ncbi:hypothetical protein AAY473_000399 [Plecturocebus cupreus]
MHGRAVKCWIVRSFLVDYTVMGDNASRLMHRCTGKAWSPPWEGPAGAAQMEGRRTWALPGTGYSNSCADNHMRDIEFQRARMYGEVEASGELREASQDSDILRLSSKGDGKKVGLLVWTDSSNIDD